MIPNRRIPLSMFLNIAHMPLYTKWPGVLYGIKVLLHIQMCRSESETLITKTKMKDLSLDQVNILFTQNQLVICSQHDLSHHCYAHNIQVYTVVLPKESWLHISRKLDACWLLTQIIRLDNFRSVKNFSVHFDISLALYYHIHYIGSIRHYITWNACSIKKPS